MHTGGKHGQHEYLTIWGVNRLFVHVSLPYFAVERQTIAVTCVILCQRESHPEVDHMFEEALINSQQEDHDLWWVGPVLITNRCPIPYHMWN